MKRFFLVCLLILLIENSFPLSTEAKDYDYSIMHREYLNIDDIRNSEELHLLAQVINGEARGESYLGKIAVGAVIVNRKESPLFPDNLKDVIYQPRAFTCVDDGQISLDADDESYYAALESYMGLDPTDGCIFYYNPDTATSRWMHKRPSEHVIKIGNHVFMK